MTLSSAALALLDRIATSEYDPEALLIFADKFEEEFGEGERVGRALRWLAENNHWPQSSWLGVCWYVGGKSPATCWLQVCRYNGKPGHGKYDTWDRATLPFAYATGECDADGPAHLPGHDERHAFSTHVNALAWFIERHDQVVPQEVRP